MPLEMLFSETGIGSLKTSVVAF